MNKQISNFSRRKFVGFGLASALAPSVVRGKSPNGKLNMGIIGSGGRGGANLNGVKAENIHTLCDINRKTLEAVQKRFKGAKTTTDWREVVSNPDIDAVVISTADHHHAPAAIAAMRAGKHVYCEKSSTTSFESAKKILNTVKQNNVRIMEGFMFKFHSQHQKVRELITNDKIQNTYSLIYF